jgi:hypothetical protein
MAQRCLVAASQRTLSTYDMSYRAHLFAARLSYPLGFRDYSRGVRFHARHRVPLPCPREKFRDYALG